MATASFGRIEFQSTPPARAATLRAESTRAAASVSIHAAREGGDFCGARDGLQRCEFQSTPPARAATPLLGLERLRDDVSIHAAREGGDPLFGLERLRDYVSIHAAREGGDVDGVRTQIDDSGFNPRRPRGRRPCRRLALPASRRSFNPRRPRGRRPL